MPTGSADPAERSLGAYLGARFRTQAAFCAAAGAPLYEHLASHAAAELEAGGELLRLLAPLAAGAGRRALALRLLARIHRRVLAGELPGLAAHYPSAGGSLAPAGSWPKFRAAVLADPVGMAGELKLGCQTSEVGRAAPLLAGLCQVAADTGLPLRLLELGAGAGLTLRCEEYRDAPWMAAMFTGPPPALFATAVRVIERRGCDLNPIDPATAEGELTLRSFLWPDRLERFERLEAALEVCRRMPVSVDRADGADWLPARLAELRPGAATVVLHSVVMQYPSRASLAAMGAALQAAATVAVTGRPLAWLRLEPPPGSPRAELRLSLWPGGEDRLLATSTPHGDDVRWPA